MPSALRVGVMGAGAIGCYAGGRLASAGVDVVLVGRERLKRELDASGLTTVDLDGKEKSANGVVVETSAAALADRDVVLLCVKSAQTAETAGHLATLLAPKTIVVSLQNGVHNADVVRERAPQTIALGGIVGFNVVSKDGGVFRRATSGPLVIEASSDARVGELARALRACGFEVEVTADIRAMQWSKLVMNLNNAVSALSDAPTKQIVLTPGYRKVVAAIVEEALDVMRAAKIRPKRVGPLPVHVFPYALRLPTPLIRLVARAQLKIDPEARSSMWEDLSRGRETEVDYLNGEIVRLAESVGAKAPINARVVELVHEVEAKKAGSPKLDPDALWRALNR